MTKSFLNTKNIWAMRIERCVAAAMRQCYNATMRHVITCDNGGKWVLQCHHQDNHGWTGDQPSSLTFDRFVAQQLAAIRSTASTFCLHHNFFTQTKIPQFWHWYLGNGEGTNKHLVLVESTHWWMFCAQATRLAKCLLWILWMQIYVDVKIEELYSLLSRHCVSVSGSQEN